MNTLNKENFPQIKLLTQFRDLFLQLIKIPHLSLSCETIIEDSLQIEDFNDIVIKYDYYLEQKQINELNIKSQKILHLSLLYSNHKEYVLVVYNKTDMGL